MNTVDNRPKTEVNMNEFDLTKVTGGSGSYAYVFYNNQRIWGPNRSRVICVNMDVATNNAEYIVPVTVTSFGPMTSEQDLTMTTRLLQEYLNLYGLYEG